MTEERTLGPDAAVTLQEITQATLRPILKLSDTLKPNQDKMVAPNAVSIAEAHFCDKAWFRAIYADETPVGFVMLYIDQEKDLYYLWRLMIGGDYQGHGFGRRAMEQVIEHVRTHPDAKEMKASYVPIEGGPKAFYHSLGFTETGEMDGDEVVIRLAL